MKKELDYYSLAKILQHGIISFIDDNTIEYLKYLKNMCIVLNTDTITDTVFKEYVTYGNLQYVNDKYKYKKVLDIKPSDIIFYRQCSSVEITILAKTMYLNTNKNMEFLKHQIEFLIKNGYIDIYEEHVKYLQHLRDLEIQKEAYDEENDYMFFVPSKPREFYDNK